MRTLKLTTAITALICFFIPQCVSGQEMVSELVDKGLEKVISYDVATFIDVRDRKISDVMAKMPGMSVSTAYSTITVNGVYVSKLFVNGIDMLGEDYTSVFDMKPEEVERIEITDNFVEEKVMRGQSFSSTASVNVILKPDARNKWSGAVKAGIGATPFLYNGDASALNIGSKAQTTFNLKADNTGLDYSGNLFTTGYMGSRVSQLIYVDPSLAPLSSQRVRTNNSALGSVTSAIHLKDDLQLNLSLTMHSDGLSAGSYSETTYHMDGGETVRYTDGQEAQTSQKDIIAHVTFLSNTEKKYLRDNICFYANWGEAHKDISGSYPSDQSATSNLASIQNTLDWKFPIGKNILSINWIATYESRPQYLDLKRDIGELSQDISSWLLYSDFNATYNVKMGDFTLGLTGSTVEKLWNFKTEMTPIEEINSRDNDSKYAFINGNGAVTLTYINDKLQVQLYVPVNYYSHRFNDHVSGEAIRTGNWHFSPTFDVKYEAAKGLSISGSASLTDSGVSTGSIYSGMVLTDYQSVSQGYVGFDGDISKNVYLSATYRHPKSSLFLNASASRTWNNQARMYVSSFTPNFIITGSVPDPDRTPSITDFVYLSASKGINKFKGKVGFNASYSHYESSLTRNESLLTYVNNYYYGSVNVNGKLFPWMNIIYNIGTSYSTLNMYTDGGIASTTKGLTQNLEFIFTPWERLNFSFYADHYHNQLTDEEFKNFVLMDFKAEFKINDRWQLHGSLTNLLNQETYDYTIIDSSTATTSYASYRIRPRNFLLSAYFKF